MPYIASLAASAPPAESSILKPKDIEGYLIFVNCGGTTVPIVIEEEPDDPRIYEVGEVWNVTSAWDGSTIRLKRSSCGLGCMCGVEFA